MDAAVIPTQIRPASRLELAVSWGDRHESLYQVRRLRLACKCARCVHEFTRAPLLDPASVPQDVRPTKIEAVGRYGMRILWSDGHDTGIMRFDDLRALCPCEECRIDSTGGEAAGD